MVKLSVYKNQRHWKASDADGAEAAMERKKVSCFISRHETLTGGAGVLKDEHPSEAPVSLSNAVSISSSGILSMLNGFLLALMMRVK